MSVGSGGRQRLRWFICPWNQWVALLLLCADGYVGANKHSIDVALSWKKTITNEQKYILPETASSPCASRFAVCYSSGTRRRANLPWVENKTHSELKAHGDVYGHMVKPHFVVCHSHDTRRSGLHVCRPTTDVNGRSTPSPFAVRQRLAHGENNSSPCASG